MLCLESARVHGESTRMYGPGRARGRFQPARLRETVLIEFALLPFSRGCGQPRIPVTSKARTPTPPRRINDATNVALRVGVRASRHAARAAP